VACTHAPEAHAAARPTEYVRVEQTITPAIVRDKMSAEVREAWDAAEHLVSEGSAIASVPGELSMTDVRAWAALGWAPWQSGNVKMRDGATSVAQGGATSLDDARERHRRSERRSTARCLDGLRTAASGVRGAYDVAPSCGCVRVGFTRDALIIGLGVGAG
jgi:hypothetical protein